MQTPNGQNACVENNDANTSVDTRNVSKTKTNFSPAQVQFLDYLICHGVGELSKSLKLVHDMALYHSDVTFNEAEKEALLDLKILWEGFERIGEED